MSEVGSLIPQHVNIMALTATAADSTMRGIMHDINMCNPVIVQVSHKSNLLYSVEMVDSLRNSFGLLIMSLKSKRLEFIRTIIFCTRQTDCGSLYELFHGTLEEQFTEPVGVPISLPQYRLVNMFTKATEDVCFSTVCQYKFLFKSGDMYGCIWYGYRLCKI